MQVQVQVQVEVVQNSAKALGVFGALDWVAGLQRWAALEGRGRGRGWARRQRASSQPGSTGWGPGVTWVWKSSLRFALSQAERQRWTKRRVASRRAAAGLLVAAAGWPALLLLLLLLALACSCLLLLLALAMERRSNTTVRPTFSTTSSTHTGTGTGTGTGTH